MESQKQPEYIDTTPPQVIGASVPVPLAELPPAPQSDQQLRQIGTQISVFLSQLPDYVGRFFNNYKQPVISFALIVAALIAIRVVLAILGALIDIPLLAPIFELVGIGYSVWFINHYLLKVSSRQELSKDLQSLKQQVVGDQKILD